MGLSAPVKDSNEKTVGVLLAAVELDKMNQQWLTGVSIKNGKGFGVLVDDRFHILVHQDAPKDYKPKKGENPPTFADCGLFGTLFRNRDDPMGADTYRDPLNDTDYVAGYMRISFDDVEVLSDVQRRWGVLVQIENDLVVKPAEDLRRELIMWGAIILTIALLVIFGSWLGLYWHLRREEKLAYG